jgi:hypothetical protein
MDAARRGGCSGLFTTAAVLVCAVFVQLLWPPPRRPAFFYHIAHWCRVDLSLQMLIQFENECG